MLVDARIRGIDKWGSGAYGAPRDGGTRAHRGIDIACVAGTGVLSVTLGKVTKIGYPYSPSNPKKGHFRYVEVTDPSGNRHRYFYVEPKVTVGDTIGSLQCIGDTQGLTKVYPGITDHFHYEVIDKDGNYLDPGPLTER